MTESTKKQPVKKEPEAKKAPSPKKKYYDIAFYHDWCKACGICMAFCPKQIIAADKSGKPVIEEPDKCIGCRFCEIHCPDFAITVSQRLPKRRKDDV